MAIVPRTAQMDNPYYDFSAISSRPGGHWPGDKTVSISLVVVQEHVEFEGVVGEAKFQLPGSSGGLRLFPKPNLPFYAQREYGHRVGIFRILDMADQIELPVSVAIDALTAELYPEVVERAKRSGAELVAHGIAANQLITAEMPETEERAYITAAKERIAAATGVTPTGWYSPEQSESPRTPALLDEAGFDYVLDWPNDDQPYAMKTPNQLVSVPTYHMLDDVVRLWGRPALISHHVELIERGFTELVRGSAQTPRSMVLVVHPWMMGQPALIGGLTKALTAIVEHPATFVATTAMLAELCKKAYSGV